MVKDVKAYKQGCQECNRIRPMTIACSMGRIMLRDSEMHYEFSHVSLDPLGSIKVSWGRSVREVTPLIIQCLTTKYIYLGLMQDSTTNSIYKEIAKCSLRYNGKIKHIYSDRGVNIQQRNLFGDSGSIVVFQNLAYMQLRNVSESSTLAIKRLIKGLTSKQNPTNVF